MAVTIPETSLRQVRKLMSVDSSNARGLRIQYKDVSVSRLETAATAFLRGDSVETGWILDSWQIEGVPGGGGMLTLMCVPEDTTGGDTPVQTALKAVWTCKSVRNDVSILAYCGSSASRVSLELWMKETDAALAEAYSFHKTESTTDALNSVEQAIAEKIKKGVESVIRFYPVLTCTSTWSRIPQTFMESLGFVDTPGAPSADETHAPSNLSNIISAHSWLKVQDDVEETGDGKFKRIESWMGLKSSDSSSGWDVDLYGSNRWAMPHAG